MNILDWSLRGIMKDGLGLKPYKIQRQKLLSNATNQKWLGKKG